ncbi:MAG: hypothetical protein IPK60_21640 [Sandaracinaceae bacterium]|nr:hypothetical protein [Sandaracinaceae bacterium]
MSLSLIAPKLALRRQVPKGPSVISIRCRAVILALAAGVFLNGCKRFPLFANANTDAGRDAALGPAPDPHARVDSRPPPMARPVALWEHAHSERQIDAALASTEGYIILDLGEEWTPYLFSERGSEAEPIQPSSFRVNYLALARGEFPNNQHGDRAREDEYLELYGIAPTLKLLRTRFHAVNDNACEHTLDLTALAAFNGAANNGQSDAVARRDAQRFDLLQVQVRRLLARNHAETLDTLDRTTLRAEDRDLLTQYDRVAPRQLAIRAAQTRLECEGFFRGVGRVSRGAIDWASHLALAKFEKRNRVYGWGALSRDTLEALRKTPFELEREAVVRVLTERAMQALGVLEDGSITQFRYRGRDGAQHPIRNMEAEVQAAVVEAFGLATPESTLAFLDGLGEMPSDAPRWVAIHGPELPEYYAGDMDLTVEIDRGDVWYDFPYDEQGNELPQSVERRPRTTIFTSYMGQRIPLARFGTTIGGWRTEFVDGVEWWKYKGSPFGPVVWTEIVSAPVWLPPETTPPKSLLNRTPRSRRRQNPLPYEVDYHETGPSYASAYGLVAAYHHPYAETEGGDLRLMGDEGIRSHGSVDYMSIMRRHSHGCHRLHNHIAVRLMSFVLAHRPHHRIGQQHINFQRDLEYQEETYHMEIREGGYVFNLDRPIRVEVLEGRVRGELQRPVEVLIPKFNPDMGAYVLPDGGAVAFRHGNLVEVPLPPPPLPTDGDGGVLPPPSLDASVPLVQRWQPVF